MKHEDNFYFDIIQDVKDNIDAMTDISEEDKKDAKRLAELMVNNIKAEIELGEEESKRVRELDEVINVRDNRK